MKLTVLTDKIQKINAYYLGRTGLCFYIEDGDAKILLDIVNSDVFLRNAETMNRTLRGRLPLFLSHGHDDHTRGLVPLIREIDCHDKRLVAHRAALELKRSARENCGPPYTAGELANIFRLELTDKPLKISENITFLGEIPQYVDFELRNVLANDRRMECGYRIYYRGQRACV